MDAFQNFVTQMVSQIPERQFAETDDAQPNEHAALKATFLWSMLELIHEDLHALCRRKPNGKLGEASVTAVNRAFEGVKRFLTGTPHGEYLGVLVPDGETTHADALMVLSHYRSALRWYRIEHLNEDPCAF
jgi:hypothetical protein